MDGAKIYILDETNTMNEYFGARIEGGKVNLFLYRNTVVYVEK